MTNEEARRQKFKDYYAFKDKVDAKGIKDWSQARSAYNAALGAATSGDPTAKAPLDADAWFLKQANKYAMEQAQGTSQLRDPNGNRFGLAYQQKAMDRDLANAASAGQSFDAAMGNANKVASSQQALANMMAARARGEGPSAIGFQAQAAGDSVARQAAGASVGNLLAARNAMNAQAGAGVGMAAQYGGARGEEVSAAQSATNQQLSAMRGSAISSAAMMGDRQLGLIGQRDALEQMQGAFETRKNIANMEAEEARRQRMLRSTLAQLGREDAAASQSAMRSGAMMQGLIGGAGQLAQAGISAASKWQADKNAEEARRRAANGGGNGNG